MLKDEVKKNKRSNAGLRNNRTGRMPILRPDYCLGSRSNMEAGRSG